MKIYSILTSTIVAAGLLLQTTTSFSLAVSAKAYVSPRVSQGACPKKFIFKGVISSRRHGRVQYKWIRSDGANSPVKTIVFARPGSKSVATTWTLGGPSLPYFSGWQTIKIIYPHRLISNRAAFKLRCKGRSPNKKLPDLIVKISGPGNLYSGHDIGSRLRVTARNIGRGFAPGTSRSAANGYMIDVFLSKDRRAPRGYAIFSRNYREDVLLRGGRISNTSGLRYSQSRSYRTGGGIPRNTPTGKYFICAKVDSGNKVRERSEVNNVSCYPVLIKNVPRR